MWDIAVDNIKFQGLPLFIESLTGIITTRLFSWRAVLDILLDTPIQVDGIDITLRQIIHIVLALLPPLKPSEPCTPCRRPTTRPTGCGSALPVNMTPARMPW
jgi:hypothetical protein